MNESFMKKLTVLIIDSEGELTFELEGVLASKVKAVHYIKEPAEAIKNFSTISPQLVIMDLKLAMMDIVDLVSKIKNINPECEVIIILGFAEPHKLVEMVNMGIYRFLLKPISVPKLSDTISKAVDALMDKALSFQYKYMQEILNTESNPVFATDGKVVLKANKAFLDCFGAKSLSQFLAHHPTINTIFILDKEKMSSPGWLKEFVSSSEPTVEVYDNRKNTKRVFLLDMAASESAHGQYVVTMSDITDIEHGFDKKIEMLSSQITAKEKVKFRSMLDFEIARCKRHKKSFSLVIIELDIKKGEDIEAWEKIFKAVRQILRSSDLVAKVDKDQVAVIATETHEKDAVELLGRLKEELLKLCSNSLQLSVKGCAVEYAQEDGVDSLFKKAVNGLQ